MSIRQAINTALSTVTNNTWAVELPENPTFPAVVFEIETNPEDIWAYPAGSAYDQHTVSITILARTFGEIETLLPQVTTAIETVEGYMLDGERGDAEYQDDPSIYGYYTNHVIRSRRF